jgi:hypothetical protein
MATRRVQLNIATGALVAIVFSGVCGAQAAVDCSIDLLDRAEWQIVEPASDSAT